MDVILMKYGKLTHKIIGAAMKVHSIFLSTLKINHIETQKNGKNLYYKILKSYCPLILVPALEYYQK